MKKGTIALIGSSVVFLIVALLLTSGKIEVGKAHIVGGDTLDILKGNYYPEKILIYIEESAKLSIIKAENNGGLDKTKFLGIFNEHLKKLDETKGVVYTEKDLEIKEGYLLGKSEQTIILNFENIEYKIKPKFKQKIKFIPKDVILTEINNYITEASEKYEVNEKIISAIIKRESNFDVDVGCNKDGACGLMQIKEIAYKDVKNIYNVDHNWEEARDLSRENILTGTAYFKIQKDNFNDLRLALTAYTWGPTEVINKCKNGFDSCKDLPKVKKEYVLSIYDEVGGLF